MRTVTAAALAELTKEQGTEPLVIIGIEWSVGSITYYSDKKLPQATAKIHAISEIESIVIENKTSQSVNVVLDDIGDEIKNIVNTRDIHKINCFVYQYYGALSDFNDKFVLFQGQISTPFVWSEKDRTISFTIVSEIESYEVGFSPEEGQLEFVNDEFIGKPWPLCFGNVVHVPAQQVSQTLEGQLLDEICVVDQTIKWKIDRLRLQYFQWAFLMKFFTLVANGAELLAPPVGQIIPMYVQAIIAERSVMITIIRVMDLIDETKMWIKRGFGNKPLLRDLENQLDQLSVLSHIIQVRKEQVERIIDLAEFKYEIQKDAFIRIVEAYNNMRLIYAEYVELQTELCNQQECAISQVRVEGGNRFPQGELIEVFIKDVKFRGTFNDDLFTFFEEPTAKHHNIELETWHKDDDPCAPQDETNGLNLIWLKDEPPINLVGLYLFVKKRGGDPGVRHVVKVERQVGRKVYFELVEWFDAGQPPRGFSIDKAIGRLFQVPFVPTPWGNTLPLDIFTGDWQNSEWNQPEGRRLLQIITSIPGGVNEHELRLLAKLVFLEPYDALSGLIILPPRPRDVYTIIGEDIEMIQEASGLFHRAWLDNWLIPPEEVPESTFWNATPGSSVRLSNKDCVIYIANILPSVIHAIHAYRTLENGSRILAPVPSSYYIKNETAILGTITVTALTFSTALSNIPGEGWEDDIYVTLTSPIGPNVCDIIQWLIETYTNVSINVANFAAIKAKFQDIGGNELYPANFALFNRPNVLEEIQQIAWEARCAIYRIGNEFFLKYLAEEPTEDITFTESDVSSSEHLQLTFPETDDLITRLVAYWNPTYLPLEPTRKPHRIILRRNVKKYGLHSEDIEFHIYNIKELVYKSATFWLIRRASTWKQVTFQTFLTNIRLEAFDTIKLNFTNKYVSNSAIKGVIKTINYDTSENLLSVELELPILAGEMEPYKWYWPALQPATDEFPLPIEIEEGYAGGFGPGSGVTGIIDDC